MKRNLFAVRTLLTIDWIIPQQITTLANATKPHDISCKFYFRIIFDNKKNKIKNKVTE